MSGTDEDHHSTLEELEELEELGDDAIIAQQTAAHAPQPRVNVAEESRSVVIADHHKVSDTEPPRAARSAAPRSSAEATVVIRDRRALDELRTQIERDRLKKTGRRRPIFLWGVLGLAAFVLGGVVAFLATDGRSDGQPTPPGRVEAQIALPRVVAPSSPTALEPATPSVRLDDLPVEPPRKR